MNRITLTADGSNTLYNETIGEHYHSRHGALQESKHVFIEAGLVYTAGSLPSQEISILEIGFGTGLNFLLSAAWCNKHQTSLKYTALEAFPLTIEELESTGYNQYVPETMWSGLVNNYGKALQQMVNIVPDQQLRIVHTYLHRYETALQFDLIYYDAFSVQHQPEMWTDEIIAHTYRFLKPGGIFVTYAITGKLKRALKALGFTIEKTTWCPWKKRNVKGNKCIGLIVKLKTINFNSWRKDN